MVLESVENDAVWETPEDEIVVRKTTMKTVAAAFFHQLEHTTGVSITPENVEYDSLAQGQVELGEKAALRRHLATFEKLNPRCAQKLNANNMPDIRGLLEWSDEATKYASLVESCCYRATSREQDPGSVPGDFHTKLNPKLSLSQRKPHALPKISLVTGKEESPPTSLGLYLKKDSNISFKVVTRRSFIYNFFESIILEKCGISELGKGLEKFANCRKLNLSDNEIDHIDIARLPDKLVIFHIYHNNVSDIYSSSLHSGKQLTELAHLGLGCNSLTASSLNDSGLSTLFPNIKLLDLSYNEICDVELLGLALENLLSLRELHVEGNPFTMCSGYLEELVTALGPRSKVEKIDGILVCDIESGKYTQNNAQQELSVVAQATSKEFTLQVKVDSLLSASLLACESLLQPTKPAGSPSTDTNEKQVDIIAPNKEQNEDQEGVPMETAFVARVRTELWVSLDVECLSHSAAGESVPPLQQISRSTKELLLCTKIDPPNNDDDEGKGGESDETESVPENLEFGEGFTYQVVANKAARDDIELYGLVIHVNTIQRKYEVDETNQEEDEESEHATTASDNLISCETKCIGEAKVSLLSLLQPKANGRVTVLEQSNVLPPSLSLTTPLWYEQLSQSQASENSKRRGSNSSTASDSTNVLKCPSISVQVHLNTVGQESNCDSVDGTDSEQQQQQQSD